MNYYGTFCQTRGDDKNRGRATIKKYENVTILFTDFKDFTLMASSISPIKLVKATRYLSL